VTNTGDTVLHHPAVTLAWGRGSSPDGFIAPPDLGDLAPGQTTVSRVPIPMHALSFGTYRVTIDADPAGGESASGFAETTIVPWGLIVMALVLLQLVLLSIRNRYRRRHLPVDATAGAAGPSTDQTDPDADAPDETLDPVLQPAGAPSSDGPAVDTTARPERVDG
jgi:hypothetical protein